MPPSIQTLGISQMPLEERIVLMQEIWNTIAAESPPPLLSESQRLELRRRIAEDNANPDDVIPWDQVKVQALAQLNT
jgi:putative addiction module component (TIGR02574 family)